MMYTLFLSAALAADVYLNGLKVDLLPEATLSNVTVRLDPAGNVWITAPQYNVQEVPAATTAARRPAAAAGVAPGVAAVPSGVWWLVSQDDTVGGHVVDILINGVTVRRVQSGDAQILLDIGGYLHQGANTVRFVTPPGTQPGAGNLTLYVGQGGNVGGTVRIDRADIRYPHSSSEGPAGGAKEFVLQVP